MKRLLFVLLILLCGISILRAESTATRNKEVISYVFSPEAYLGFNLSSFREKKVGFYFEVKYHPLWMWEDNYYKNINYRAAVYTYGNSKIDQKEAWLIFNGGVTYLLDESIGLYFGGGFTSKQNYSQFFDPLYILGNEGKYWVEGPGTAQYKINVNGGVQFLLPNSLVILLGADMEPRAFNIGIGYCL